MLILHEQILSEESDEEDDEDDGDKHSGVCCQG